MLYIRLLGFLIWVLSGTSKFCDRMLGIIKEEKHLREIWRMPPEQIYAMVAEKQRRHAEQLAEDSEIWGVYEDELRKYFAKARERDAVESVECRGVDVNSGEELSRCSDI